jgi:hypothetical protein
MVTIGKTKRFLEAKESQCHNMGFYVINNASITLSKVNSSHLELEQLRCVLCYLVDVAHVELKKGGIISYKYTNKILTLRKHLETSH